MRELCGGEKEADPEGGETDMPEKIMGTGREAEREPYQGGGTETQRRESTGRRHAGKEVTTE